ncbi:MAG TPA: type II secretion system F family protein [Gammaproteobacteria bacterium]|nr:type II secretion system F family protein [Gammaproteobacteria bacterium]
MRPAPFTSAQRATLFRALARLENAGVPASRAVAAMTDLLGAGHAPRFRGMSASIAGGASLTEAGSRFGLFSARDRELLRLAEHSGTLERAASLLADAYDYRARVFGKLRSRMMLPLFVLVLGLVLLPLPALVAGRIGGGEFLWRSIAPVAGLIMTAGLLTRLLRRTAARGVSRAAGRLGLRLPVLAPALARSNRLKLLEGLVLLLRAGVPARDALEAALNALTNPAARSGYAPALTRLEQSSLSSALRSVGVLEADEFAIASASEEAGRLVDGLERVAGKLRQRLESRLDTVSEWLPRGIYLAVMAVIAVGLIG